jgi:hypothetical protein
VLPARLNSRSGGPDEQVHRGFATEAQQADPVNLEVDGASGMSVVQNSWRVKGHYKIESYQRELNGILAGFQIVTRFACYIIRPPADHDLATLNLSNRD